MNKEIEEVNAEVFKLIKKLDENNTDIDDIKLIEYLWDFYKDVNKTIKNYVKGDK